MVSDQGTSKRRGKEVDETFSNLSKRQKKQDFSSVGPIFAGVHQTIASQESTEQADAAVARFLNAAGIQLTLANSKAFQEMADAIVAVGPSYKITSLRGELLNRSVLDVSEYDEEPRKSREVTGCSKKPCSTVRRPEAIDANMRDWEEDPGVLEGEDVSRIDVIVLSSDDSTDDRGSDHSTDDRGSDDMRVMDERKSRWIAEIIEFTNKQRVMDEEESLEGEDVSRIDVIVLSSDDSSDDRGSDHSTDDRGSDDMRVMDERKSRWIAEIIEFTNKE